MSNESKFIPNFLQVPNAVIDELLPDLTGAELKCYLVVIRKTKGWNKESDNISISQFMKATGLSNSAVIKACESLVKYGLLIKQNGARNTGVYAVNSYSKTTCEESSQVTCEKSSHTINNIKNTIQNTNKKNTKKSESDLLAEFGIYGQLAVDFITHRKACKAPITKTSLKGFQREADNLGMPIAEAVTYAIERGWRGFKAEWYRRDMNSQSAAQSTANKPKFSNNQSGWAAGVEVEVDGQLWKF